MEYGWLQLIIYKRFVSIHFQGNNKSTTCRFLDLILRLISMNHTVWFILYGAKKLLFNKFQKDFREWFSRRLVFDDTLLCFSEYGFLIFFGYFLSFTTTRGIFQTRTVKNYLYDNKWDNAVLNSHVRGLCFGPYQSDKRKSRCDEYCDGEKDLVGRFSRASFQKYTKMTEQVTFSGN